MTQTKPTHLEFDFDIDGNVRCTFVGVKTVNQKLNDFITEAIDVRHKTQLTPRQLLAQRDTARKEVEEWADKYADLVNSGRPNDAPGRCVPNFSWKE